MEQQLRQKLELEMQWSERVVGKNIDVVTRFLIVAPEGDYHVLLPMMDDPGDRTERLKLLAGFMAWKMATAFVVSGENIHPAGIFSFAVSSDGVEGLFRMIERGEGGEFVLGPIVTLNQDQCDPEFVLILPNTRREIDAETMAQMEVVFGIGGEMQARHVN